jgi:hypothetical protein
MNYAEENQQFSPIEKLSLDITKRNICSLIKKRNLFNSSEKTNLFQQENESVCICEVIYKNDTQ